MQIFDERFIPSTAEQQKEESALNPVVLSMENSLQGF